MKGNTALHLACFIPDQKKVELLLEHAPDLQIENLEGMTPVDAACQYGGSGLFQTITRRSDLRNYPNSVHFAAKNQSPGVLKAILEQNADLANSGFSMEPKGSPLHVAASCGLNQNVKVLLQAGAKVNFKDSVSSQKPTN